MLVCLLPDDYLIDVSDNIIYVSKKDKNSYDEPILVTSLIRYYKDEAQEAKFSRTGLINIVSFLISRNLKKFPTLVDSFYIKYKYKKTTMFSSLSMIKPLLVKGAYIQGTYLIFSVDEKSYNKDSDSYDIYLGDVKHNIRGKIMSNDFIKLYDGTTN